MKIWVRGVSCSGKTTLAGRLGRELKIPHIELDELFWLPDWKQRDREEFKELVKEKLAIPHWVIDGNYTSIEETVTDKCDYIIWLNYPLHKVLWRSIYRTFNRIVKKEKVCNGNLETWKLFMTKEGNMIFWVLSTYRKRQIQLKQAKQDYTNIIEIRKESDIDKLIQSLQKN